MTEKEPARDHIPNKSDTATQGAREMNGREILHRIADEHERQAQALRTIAASLPAELTFETDRALMRIFGKAVPQ